MWARSRLGARRLLLLAGASLLAWAPVQAGKRTAAPEQAQAASSHDSQAEARLIGVYQLIGQGRSLEALQRAEALVRTHPNFQLAQLVYGDLLTARSRPLRAVGDVPPSLHAPASETLADLREESQLRLKALRERPPADHVPAQFLKLSSRSRHAIAVDTSRARLYLLENTPGGLKLLADYYISVGKSGIGKGLEGDMRTPLGLYHITSNLERKQLRDFYGAGALPINYPNPYDVRRGKTGGGIWLHGTPPAQFARAPRATDGCIVLANPDLEHIIRTVAIRSTPVLIANSLSWVAPAKLFNAEVQAFQTTLEAWRHARAEGDLQRLLSFYTPDLSYGGKDASTSHQLIKAELQRAQGRDVELKDLSYLRWTDTQDTMVVTFGEVPLGARTGPRKRQYWLRTGSQWKIFYEGVIG
jgi:L,D-transpeptidase YnhG